MFITSISLSYVLAGVAVAFILAFLYFKVLVVKSSDKSSSHDKIVGSMKDPDTWRRKNNTMSYVSLFWAVAAAAAFIYLKYYVPSTLIPLWYLFAFAAVLFISFGLFGFSRRKAH
jgi:L-asparagine transporter-like permease